MRQQKQDESILSPRRAKGTMTRSINLVHNIFWHECIKQKDYLVVKLLQRQAKKEGHPFVCLCEREQRSGLVFFTTSDGHIHYMGIVVWTEKESAVLRQVYVSPFFRGSGIGTRMLKFWVEQYADKINSQFGVESPNESSQRVLLKLGYAEIDGEYLVGQKCFFVKY